MGSMQWRTILGELELNVKPCIESDTGIFLVKDCIMVFESRHYVFYEFHVVGSKLRIIF